jgi:predicted glycosyltransferase
MAQRFRVVLCSGGRVPPGLVIPAGVGVVALAPVGSTSGGHLASLDPAVTLDQAWERRAEQLRRASEEADPDVIVVELFPFGRRKFAGELIPLLERAKRSNRRPVVVCSVRDILVDGHPEKQRHDDEAAARLDAHFDAVIVHGDPRFARLEETFRPSLPPRVPFLYSGFVAPAARPRPARRRANQVIVSAGGGQVGGSLLFAAVAAHREALGPAGLTTRIVTGPFLPPSAVAALEDGARGVGGLSVERFVPDLASAMAESAVSVSQCGYNTTIDVLRSGVPALVVPHDDSRETEQTERARRLESRGLARVVGAAELTPERLAAGVFELANSIPSPTHLDLEGADRTAELVEWLLRRPAAVAS